MELKSSFSASILAAEVDTMLRKDVTPSTIKNTRNEKYLSAKSCSFEARYVRIGREPNLYPMYIQVGFKVYHFIASD